MWETESSNFSDTEVLEKSLFADLSEVVSRDGIYDEY